MVELINIDGVVILHENSEVEFLDAVRRYLASLIENDEIDGRVSSYKNNLKLLYENGFIVNRDGLLESTESTLKWYFSRIL